MIDPIWAVFDGGMLDVAALIKSLTAGPAQDAERQGFPVRAVGNVAVIPLSGLIMKRETYFGSGSDETRVALAAANADPTISSIVLHVNSPGGSVSGLDRLATAVRDSAKPVTAVVDGMAASAAYWVASQAGSVVAGRGDLVGSIGVRTILHDMSAAFEKAGVRVINVDTGEHKSAGEPGTVVTDAQVAEFQRVVDQHYGMFIDAVASGRGLDLSRARELGDGRVWTGAEAVGLGLVDRIGSVEQVIAELRQVSVSTQSRRARLDHV